MNQIVNHREETTNVSSFFYYVWGFSYLCSGYRAQWIDDKKLNEIALIKRVSLLRMVLLNLFYLLINEMVNEITWIKHVSLLRMVAVKSVSSVDGYDCSMHLGIK